MKAIFRLLKPLNYLRIHHKEKILYDWVLPPIVAVLLTSTLFFSPVKVTIFGANSVIKACTDLLQILTGFYIASLAAIATFSKQSMDDIMAGDPPILWKKTKGLNVKEQLTRRRFLCYLFGYLAFMSLFLYFIGSATIPLSDVARKLFMPRTNYIIKWAFVFIYTFLMSQLLITTLLGLYYLVDRIHRSDVVLVNRNPSTDEE